MGRFNFYFSTVLYEWIYCEKTHCVRECLSNHLLRWVVITLRSALIQAAWNALVWADWSEGKDTNLYHSYGTMRGTLE